MARTKKMFEAHGLAVSLGGLEEVCCDLDEWVKLIQNGQDIDTYLTLSTLARVKEYRANCPEYALKTLKVRIPKDPHQYRQEVRKAERKRKGAAIKPRSFGIMLARKPRSK